MKEAKGGEVLGDQWFWWVPAVCSKSQDSSMGWAEHARVHGWQSAFDGTRRDEGTECAQPLTVMQVWVEHVNSVIPALGFRVNWPGKACSRSAHVPCLAACHR